MIDESKNLSLLLDIQWNDELATYQDRRLILKTNFWRDFYPPVLDFQIKRAKLDQTFHVDYPPGALLQEEFSQSNLKTIPINKFNQHYKGPIPITPVVGRFYPRGMIEGVAGCFKMDNRPFRILGKTENSLDIDLNHPLATFPIQLTATIRDVFDANQQKGGRCNDIAEIATTNGPGMQTLLASRSSDFFLGMPFLRKIEDDDAIFYASIETQTPVDVFKQAARILKPGGVFIIAFSDRYYDKKVIALWDDVHTFERMGIVLEYFRLSGEYEDLFSDSIQGLIRHNDDHFVSKTAYSCPMFMISGKRKG